VGRAGYPSALRPSGSRRSDIRTGHPKRWPVWHCGIQTLTSRPGTQAARPFNAHAIRRAMPNGQGPDCSHSPYAPQPAGQAAHGLQAEQDPDPSEPPRRTPAQRHLATPAATHPAPARRADAAGDHRRSHGRGSTRGRVALDRHVHPTGNIPVNWVRPAGRLSLPPHAGPELVAKTTSGTPAGQLR
jgi:hypothetical protein